jgi:hypothetical protein
MMMARLFNNHLATIIFPIAFKACMARVLKSSCHNYLANRFLKSSFERHLMDSSNANNEFYIGYLPHAPAGLGKLLRRVIILLLSVAAIFAVILVINQKPFYPSVFAFGNVRTFEGIVKEHPYPTLLVARPGEAGALPEYSQYYLAGYGKFGAADWVKGMDGKPVQLQGALIYRDGQTMIKIGEANAIKLLGGVSTVLESFSLNSQAGKNLGAFQLNGEIVDSQCYLGVMNPGESKPHKECAVRCISGGVPPIFVVKNSEGVANYFLLVSHEGKTVNQEILPLVADPVQIAGEVIQYENLLVLRADPKTYKRLN